MDENLPPVAPAPSPIMQAPPAPPKKGPNKLLIVGVVIVAVVVLVAVVGVMMLNASANTNAKSTAQQMTLKQSDFPSGWHASGTTLDLSDYDIPDDVEWSYSVFNNSVTGDPLEGMAEVSCQIITYKSVDNAKADFTDLLKNGDYTFNEVSGHFDQCQVWTMDLPNVATLKMYIFQERNVCGILIFSSYYDYDMSQTWINEMLDAQEGKIA